ncbi:MAG: DUF294 nucleotidyltransferase-like domain-containing protein [Wenzhouxiangellaceae bacterium]
MEVEQVEIRNHLKRFQPFSALPEKRLDEVARQVEISYFRAGAQVISIGDPVHDLYFVRSGSVEISRRNGEIYNRLGEGDIFGQLALMTGKPARFAVRALQDSLIYFIPEAVFRQLFDDEEQFADFVEVEDRTRLRQAASAPAQGSSFMTSRVAKLISREPVIVTESTPIADAARRIADEGVSSLVVVADCDPDADPDPAVDAALPPMAGIVTTQDLVERVLARGLSPKQPISSVMTPEPHSVDAEAFLFEAMLMMLRNNIHYLPVLSRNRLVGVIDLADVVGLETQSSLFVVGNIFVRKSVPELKQLLPDVSACFVRMVNEDANSHMIGSAMSAIGRSFKQRLLELGEEQLGPPPVPYCLLALGSMARDEQILFSDQDNAMVLHDDYDPGRHADYFARLADFVCDGLAEVGYRYCSGGFMASNPAWRKTLTQWKMEFAGWIEKPKPEALLRSSVFFDLDGVGGETRLGDELKTFVAEHAAASPRFLACLALNAQNRTPPLGFFKDFVLEKSGHYQRTINLKRRGTAPLVDVIRAHALASGSRRQNSFRRLQDVVATGFLTGGMADDLRDALEFISIIRARHQAFEIEAGRVPNNNLDPETLPRLDRRSLKDAFTVLANAQKFIRFRYRG